MIKLNVKKCESCAWLKADPNDIMCKCMLRGFYVYKYSVACSEWSSIGLL